MRTPSRSGRSSPPRLEWSGNDDADRLIAADPVALLIGFCLDQQITVQHAFNGPLTIRERLGTLDAGRLARIDPGRFEAAFRQVPAVHRYPASMAKRVQALCAHLDTEYGGDAARLWLEAPDSQVLLKRFAALPGFGPMKAAMLVAVVGKHFGVRPPGWDAVAPGHLTLADVSTAEELAAYQAQKRAHKARLREAARAAAPTPEKARATERRQRKPAGRA